MSARKATDLEKKIHKAALKAHNKELSVEDVAEIIPDNKTRTDALNFLLKVGLFKSLKNEKGKVSFRAVTKEEITVTKDLTAEEGLVLSHIKASKNEGIWTKHLKAKTNLAQALIEKCLKTLTQKKLIKRVPSVQHPTRKIYMLEGIDPSVALTGGPWYTDNELDVAFINTLTRACLKIVRDMSSPRSASGDKQGALYPVGKQPEYPTAQKIRSALQRAHLTDTDLSEEHVESLLNVLILDGEIERIPVGISVPRHDDAESSDEEIERSSKKKRKRKSDVDSDRPSKKKRRKAPSSSDESDSEDDRNKKRKSSKSKSKSRGSDSDSDSEPDTSRKSRKSSKKRQLSGSDESDSEDERSSKKKKKKRSRRSRSSDSSSSDSESESEERRRREKQKRKRKLDRSPSPDLLLGVDLGESEGVYAYRAVRQEQLSLGWSQAPCSICPSFQFCKEGGPVNPTECVYYTDWLSQANVQAVDEGEQN
ncbi:RNA polymerase Rpc34 subunit-domain-containing protein [Schizophyllum fasciatum]